MDYKQIISELPPLSDETAASLQLFFHKLMHAIDEYYYPQIQRYYMHRVFDGMIAGQSQEEFNDPPF